MTLGYYTVLGPAKRHFYVRLQSRVLDLVYASTPRDFYRGPPR